MSYSSTRFTVDELGFIQTALTKVLSAAAAGELDLNRLAREELPLEAWTSKATGWALIEPARFTSWRAMCDEHPSP